MTEQSNQLSGAEAMVRMLQAYDVQHIFGLCGDTTLPLYDALARLDHGITHLLTRDERHAAYMADAYARVTGRPGICEGPSGGGATYILPGIVEANESSVPVLAITTDVATTSRGRYPLTELDQSALFRPVTKWNLSFPFDTQKAPVDATEVWADPGHSHFPAAPAAPDPAAIEAALEVLSAAKSAIAICGGGPVIAGAQEALLRLARALDLPIATTVSGQGVIAETDPLALGVVGSNGGVRATRAAVDAADVVLFIGCRAGSVTTERWRSPAPGTRIIHIDSDPEVIGANYQTEVGIVADAALALSALADAVEARKMTGQNMRGQNGAARAKAAWDAKRAAFLPLSQSLERPIRPEAVIAALMALLPDDAVICADPGTPCPYFSAHYRWPKAGRHFITNRAHGALGYALAAAIGAQVGRPQAQVLSVMGDGSFGFAVGEFETITRYKLPIKSIVFSNATFGWIKAGQNAGFGKRFYNVDFNRTDHAAVAAAYGIRSWTVDDPAKLQSVLAAAMAHDGPTLVDVISQPLHEAAAPVSEWVA